MRRLLPTVGVVLALMTGAQTARATTPGLTVTIYSIDEIPPTLDAGRYPQCGTTTLPNVNLVWEYQPVQGCPLDGFMAHLTGYLTFPAHETVTLWIAGDDGALLKVGTEEVGAWQDQGCTAYESPPLTYPAGAPIPVDLWHYENGGGTCLMAAWSLDGGPFEIIPPEAFSTTGQAPTPPATTTTSTSTTTTSTTSTTVPAPSTTYRDSSTTTMAVQTTQIPATTVQPSTTYQPTDSSNAPSVTEPTPTSSQNAPTASTTPVTTSLPTVPIPTTIAPTIPTASTVPTPPTVPPPELSSREALATAMDPNQVATLDPGEAAELFAAIDEDELTPELGAAIVAAVQTAPPSIRAAFEANVNIYGGATDNYVPIGSTVPVRTRRVIIITTGLIVAMPAATRRGTA